MIHPADMPPDERRYYEQGYAYFDTLAHLGITGKRAEFYLQGLRARLEQETYLALHPDALTKERGKD